MSYVAKQAGVVMRDFYAHKLRDSHGNPVTDVTQAKAIAHSEEEGAKSRGTEMRTFKGRTRRRPRLKK
jgi:hypothetical protein